MPSTNRNSEIHSYVRFKNEQPSNIKTMLQGTFSNIICQCTINTMQITRIRYFVVDLKNVRLILIPITPRNTVNNHGSYIILDENSKMCGVKLVI